MTQRVLPRLPRPSLIGLLTGVVARLVQADRAYRQRRALTQMPDERLEDMGIPREAIDSIR